MERAKGFEPSTPTLARLCSTPELRPQTFEFLKDVSTSLHIPCGWRTWRRPTLPRLETQYHWRGGFSRPSSGWDRVFTLRHDHQVIAMQVDAFIMSIELIDDA